MDGVVISRSTQLLVTIPLILVGLAIFKSLMTYYYSYSLNAAGQRLVAEIRNDLAGHYHRSSMSFFDRSMSGELLSRVSYDVSLIERIVPALVDLIAAPLTVFWLLGVAFWQDWRITAFSLIVFPVVGWGLAVAAKKVKARSGVIQTKVGELLSLLDETVVGARIVKAFNMEREETDRFRAKNEEVLGSGLRALRIGVLTSPAAELLGTAGFVLALAFGAWRVIEGATTPGAFSSCITALALVYQPLKKASRLNNVFPPAFAAASRIEKFLKIEPEVKERPDPVEKRSFDREIVFENVSFRYGEQWALQDFNLRIRKGEVVALVGSSGAGKSTMVNLLLRFYDPTQGRILLDDTDLRDLSFGSLRALVSLVTQDPFLFNTTIAKNVLYGSPSKSEADLLEASKVAQSHGFIEKLQRGYETLAGERGGRLSGGERQRISVARAIVKGSPVLVMDEATSSVDLEVESEIQRSLAPVLESRTAIIIAHRLYSLRNVGRIIVLDHGRLAEQGSHEELMARQGVYFRLYRSQLAEDERLTLFQPR